METDPLAALRDDFGGDPGARLRRGAVPGREPQPLGGVRRSAAALRIGDVETLSIDARDRDLARSWRLALHG